MDFIKRMKIYLENKKENEMYLFRFYFFLLYNIV